MQEGAPAETGAQAWRQVVAPYQGADTWRSIWQLVNSVVPYLLLWYLAYRLLAVSFWLTLAAAVPAAGFLVRVFIIFHDCGHGSFFASRQANTIVGFITGVMTLTPFQDWRHEHARHHATAGDLNQRGFGDIWMMTVDEYRHASWGRRLAYRLYRSPLVLLVVGPVFVFFLKQRFPRRGTGPRQRRSVLLTNLALAAIFVPLVATLGWQGVAAVQVPIMAIAGAVGVWLFYVQHQFDRVYWERGARRDPVAVALQGSSFYRLPRIIQWFTGNIGFHHIHHLSPRIPNYKLPRCYREQPLLQDAQPMTLLSSLRSLRLRLYDEDSRRMLSFREARTAAASS